MLTSHFISPLLKNQTNKYKNQTNKYSIEHKKDRHTKRKKKTRPIQCGKIVFNIKGKHVCVKNLSSSLVTSSETTCIEYQKHFVNITFVILF